MYDQVIFKVKKQPNAFQIEIKVDLDGFYASEDSAINAARRVLGNCNIEPYFDSIKAQNSRLSGPSINIPLLIS